MALKSDVFSSSGAIAGGGMLLKMLEVTPKGGSLEIRLLIGTDSSGTEKYRIRANESSEFRDFGEGLTINGPVYAYFYEGEGAITVLT